MAHESALCPELPAPPRRIATFAIIALAMGASLAVWIELPRGPLCYATLTARTTYVTAPCEGKLTEHLVDEGTAIEIGAPLMLVQDEDLDRRIESQKNKIAALELEYQQALAAAELEVNWRSRTLESEICDIQLKSASFLKEKYDADLAKNKLSDVLAGREIIMAEDADSLFESMVIKSKTSSAARMQTVLEMELAANHAEVSAAQVEICNAREQQLQDLKKSLPEKVRQTQGVDVAEAKLQQAKLELDQLLGEKSELEIVSPSIGRVGVFQHKPGDYLKPGDPLVELLDDSRRYLVVKVPSQEVPHFTLGTKVVLAFPGNETRSGNVTYVAPQTLSCNRQVESSIDAMVLVHVEQTGRVWPNVPIGSQVKVRLEQ